ncbi:hypothetical protein TL5118_00677 [Thalassovita autumnalis]|uniref:Uncharacterized protein n=1 Tax=Thalassovita autumnalis TaxID=2072972 RepID=A0A0P1F7P4_9RHOB|nr:hypothetical protein TL5118_00677 [Thalassovita autumnalis]CUH72748.1 hypothetical protein TL5120_02545 [Thalassovita autumnalis]
MAAFCCALEDVCLTEDFLASFHEYVGSAASLERRQCKVCGAMWLTDSETHELRLAFREAALDGDLTLAIETARREFLEENKDQIGKTCIWKDCSERAMLGMALCNTHAAGRK